MGNDKIWRSTAKCNSSNILLLESQHSRSSSYSQRFINPTDSLEIQSQPCRTDEEEKMRNRYSIQSLLNVNPQHYQRVRFTTEATITKISAAQGWYYRKCIACNKKVPDQTSECSDHGPQTTPNYGYCFRIIIDDNTATATITCFSLEAHTFAPDCNELVNAIENKDNRCLPNALKKFENTTYIFQYRFGTNAKLENPKFRLDAAFKTSPQPLLGLLAPESAVTPPQEVLEHASSATTPTPSESDPCQSTEEYAKRLDSSSETTKKTTKRELFRDNEPAEKKPRQET